MLCTAMDLHCAAGEDTGGVALLQLNAIAPDVLCSVSRNEGSHVRKKEERRKEKRRKEKKPSWCSVFFKSKVTLYKQRVPVVTRVRLQFVCG